LELILTADFFLLTVAGFGPEKEKHQQQAADANKIAYNIIAAVLLAVTTNSVIIVKGQDAYNYPEEPVDLIAHGKKLDPYSYHYIVNHY